ncbi:hypothetical protein RV07_GL002233 [Enterococcus malodoratus]|nr:hypothetical protein RV07_GL002233 [Enterococcus malodoratus]
MRATQLFIQIIGTSCLVGWYAYENKFIFSFFEKMITKAMS